MTDRKHSHYFRPFPYDNIDIYRFLEVFDVTCPVAQHIIKKAVASGGRGHKSLSRDWQDIVDSAQRKLEMLRENDSAWWGCSEEELGQLALQHELVSHKGITPNPDSFWGTVMAQEYQGRAAIEQPWYPNDIPGLEWKEATGGLPYKMWTHNEVYYITRLNRKNKDWSCSWTKAVNLNWMHDNHDFDIVAYAVKPVEKQTQYDFPTGVVPQ